MIGNSLVVDTNIFGFILQGSEIATEFLEEKDIYISVINKIELLTRKNYTRSETKLLETLLNVVTVIHTNNLIARLAVNFRKSYNIKLPDAIIAATDSFQNIPLFTADKELFKIAEINIIEFYP